MTSDIIRQIIVVVAVVATIAVNALANILPLNGLNTGTISDRFKVFFVPAGYVFSIWGLIYLGMIVFAVFQALPSQRSNPHLVQIGYIFVLSCVANIVWLFLWHYERFPLTIVAMLVLLGALIVIYLQLGIGKVTVSGAERWCADLPFSIYLGWITVATIANATDLLDYLKWNRLGIRPEVWAVIMLAAGTLITALMAFTRGDIAYTLVIVWAFVGIALKHKETALVANAAWVTTGLVVLALMGALVVRMRLS